MSSQPLNISQGDAPTVRAAAAGAAGDADWLPFGGGEMGERVRAFDWASTPLGPIGRWPASLRTAVGICLGSHFPMFVWWGPELINIYNDAYAPVLGRRHPDALGRPAREVWADIWPVIGDDVDTVVRRGVGVRKERVRLVMERNGYPEETFFTYSHSPIPDGSGGVGGLFQVCSDETAHVLAERARDDANARLEERVRARTAELAEVNGKFQAMYDQGLFAGVMDLDGTLLDANRSSLEQCGYSRDDVIGRPFWECGWWSRSPAVQAWIRSAVARARGGEVFRGESVYFLADGRERVVDFAMMPIKDEGGRVLFLMPTGVDVTDRRHAEDDRKASDVLRESEARFRLIADTLPQMVWATLPDGFHYYYNRRWYEFTGVPEGSTDGEGWNGMFHPDDQARAWARWRHSLATGEPYEVEYRLRHRSGDYRWTLGRALPVRNERGEIERWLGTCTDIDAMKRLTAEREGLLERERAARGEAEAASRAKDKFLAVLSHELRTPLSPVVMAIPAMASDPEMPAKFHDDLAMVRRNIDLEVKLIDDLLDLSRVTSGKLRLHPRAVGLHEVLRHAVQSSVSEAPGPRPAVVLELDAPDDRVTADPARLQQVFWNLVRNALKFTPAAGTVTVRTSNPVDGRVRVEVIDTGAGIAAGVLPRVFDAFEQGDLRTSHQFGGLGLGLAIARAVVEMHGGAISAASPGPGGGATFTVELSTVAAADAPVDTVPPASAPTAATAATAPPRVLLVEDHDDTARLLARLLHGAGYAVTTADSAAAALRIAAATTFDVVVSDIGLPDATGYELMSRLRDRHGVRGIALSGYGMEEDMRQSREAGFVDHVVKPVDVAHLEAVLRRVIGGAG